MRRANCTNAGHIPGLLSAFPSAFVPFFLKKNNNNNKMTSRVDEIMHTWEQNLVQARERNDVMTQSKSKPALNSGRAAKSSSSGRHRRVAGTTVSSNPTTKWLRRRRKGKRKTVETKLGVSSSISEDCSCDSDHESQEDCECECESEEELALPCDDEVICIS